MTVSNKLSSQLTYVTDYMKQSRPTFVVIQRPDKFGVIKKLPLDRRHAEPVQSRFPNHNPFTRNQVLLSSSV